MENEDNNSQETIQPVAPVQADNKAPAFPTMEPKVVTPAEPVDEEMKQWMDTTKTLENAYKRTKGSESEVSKWKQEAEQSKKEKDDYQKQLSDEIAAIYQKDPETAARLFGVEVPKVDVKQEGQQQPIISTENVYREVQARIEVDRFHEKNKQHMSDESDWQNIQDIALSFVGKKDRNNVPYNINTALNDAMVLRHPNLISDKAIAQHLTASANRASASEYGDVPSGTSTGGLTGEEEQMAQEIANNMGIPLDINRLRNRLNR